MKFFNCHTHTNRIQADVVSLVNQYPLEFNGDVANFSIGMHPWHIKEDTFDAECEILEKVVLADSCLAIGECGLDKRTKTDFDLQLRAFEYQLKIAQKADKPVIIHCVAAFQEIIELKNKMEIKVPLIIHGFSKNSILAAQLIKEGFYLSFGRNMLEKENVNQLLKVVPTDRIFLETDVSAFSIEEIYQKFSNISKLTIKEIESVISNNYLKVFRANNL